MIADTGNHRVRKVGFIRMFLLALCCVDPLTIVLATAQVNSAGVISTVAGTMVCSYTGDGGPATAANLNGPSNVAVAPNGDTFIADSLNSRIRMVFEIKFEPQNLRNKTVLSDRSIQSR